MVDLPTQMIDILDTEAMVIKDPYSMKDKAVISKLAGSIGEDCLKVYPLITTTINGTVFSSDHTSYFGFTYLIHRDHNFLDISSTIKEFPLRQGDNVFFHFEDASNIKCEFGTSGFKVGKQRHAYAIINNLQLQQFATYLVTQIDVHNNRSGMKVSCDFAHNTPNYQYASLVDGQRLFKIMSERIAGAKMLLIKSIS
jgi:hypothetical protein